MNDPKQNAEIESRAAKAAKGEHVPWNATPISETETARQTDPLRGAGCRLGDGWWSHAEPPFIREQGERFARASSSPSKYGRDGATADPQTEEEKYTQSNAGTDANYQYADYLPSSDEDAYGWLSNLRILIEATNERKEALSAIDKYIHGFAPGTRGEELSESILRGLLTELCEQPGGLLTRRKN